MKVQRYTRSCSGFTVSELVVTIGVGAILMGIAVPSLFAWLPTLRLNEASRQVAMDLQLTRTTAISQSLPFGLNFAAAGANAYVIFQDADNDGAYDAPGELIRGPLSLPQGITAIAAATVVFQPRGIANVATITLSNGTGPMMDVGTSIVGRVNVEPHGS